MQYEARNPGSKNKSGKIGFVGSNIKLLLWHSHKKSIVIIEVMKKARHCFYLVIFHRKLFDSYSTIDLVTISILT